MNPRSLLQYGIPIGIFLFGVAISMWYGGQGLHPLDSSIVFDGGWRVLQGQRFFVDFSAPNGFVPAFLQMCFFRVFGVNWFAYCLHAAVFNGIFAILAYGILRTASGPRWLAAGYALLSAVVFYPLMGVPYMEQHAFFFILLAIFVGLRAAKANGKWRIVLLGSLPCIVLLAVLSKQSPGMFALPLLGIVLLGWFPLREWKQLILLLLGGLIPAVLVFIVMVGLPWQISGEFWESFWNLPQALANERFEVWSYGPFKTIRTMAWFPFQVLGGFHFIHRYVLYAPFLLVPAEWLFRKLKNKPRADWPPFRILFLAIGLTGTCSFFMNFTLNQPENGLPFVFVALGLGHIFWRESWKGFEANLQFRPKWLAPSMLILSLLFLANGAISAFHFHGKANSTRIA
jgi:hypothetical protein